jgi:CYTH domain-containing protein
MDIDQKLATALGFPKPHYTAVERERRWLVREVPRALIRLTYSITDLYVDGARLRLREMRAVDGGTSQWKLTRKGDVDSATRLITTIYLPENEFQLLARVLPGQRLTKIRHRLHTTPGVLLSVDEFQGELAGLLLAEAEFNSVQELAAFPTPDFAEREVTDELELTGGWLAHHGWRATRA